MKEIFFLLVLSLLSVWKANAQITAESFKEYYRSPQYRDSLKQKLIHAGEDSSKADLLGRIAFSYSFLNSDSAAYYEREALELSKKISYKIGEEYSLQGLCFSLSLSGNFAGALDFGMKALSLSETMKDTAVITGAYGTLMNSYVQQDDYKQALKYGLKAELFSRSSKVDLGTRAGIVGILGVAYQNSGQLDSGLYYCLKAQQLNLKLNLKWGGIYRHLGDIYFKKGVTDSAMYYYRIGLPIAENSRVYIDVVDIYYGMSKVFELAGKIDSSVYHAQKSIVEESILSYPEGKLRAATQLAHLYDIKGLRDSTIKYLKLSFALRENLFSREKTREVQSFAFNEQIHQQELQQKSEQDKLEYKNRLNVYFLLAGLVVLLLVAVGLWRRNVFRRKSFALLQKQKHETDNQKAKVEQTLDDLRVTQSQLIQSEKMASLGELTAGIAHEIQNPLNFVNNFSEVNKELIDEMQQEMDKGNNVDAKAISNNIKANEEKINHHGKRADAIVKGMLQHSRSSTGVKESTDINALADEYLRLSYHGLRAKDKEFNAIMNTDFDNSIGTINIIPQDIGRVLLNLYNNAFYAVTEKRKQYPENYEPTVTVTTKKIGDKVILTVKDNGNGIPQKVVDKIFQPFFTTKPTGEGTGLGLSLSYDIIKAHGGEIKVNTIEGEFTEFVIQLPMSI